MFSLHTHLEIPIERAVMMRARPRRPEVMVNVGASAVARFDVVSGASAGKASFPRPDDVFLIYEWLVSPDGRLSYLFSSEQDTPYAIELDHDHPERSRTLALPDDFGPPLGHCWFAPELHLRDARGQTWALVGDALVPLEEPEQGEDPFAALREELVVMKMSPEDGGAYVVNRRGDLIGYVSRDLQTELLALHNGRAIGAARHEASLWVCYVDRIVQVTSDSERVDLTAPEGEMFMAVEVIQRDGEALLVVLAGPKTEPRAALKVFRLEPRGP